MDGRPAMSIRWSSRSSPTMFFYFRSGWSLILVFRSGLWENLVKAGSGDPAIAQWRMRWWATTAADSRGGEFFFFLFLFMVFWCSFCCFRAKEVASVLEVVLAGMDGGVDLREGEADFMPFGFLPSLLFTSPTCGFRSEDSDVPLPDNMRQKRDQPLWFGNSGPSTKNHMDQAIHRNNAGAASEWSASRLTTVLRSLRPLGCLSSTHCAGNDVAVAPKENVGGYLVKASTAPTLRLIFAKHGNIASNFSLHLFPEVVAGMLEKVSNVFKSLLEDDFSYVLSEWDRMMAVTKFIALLGMDLSWLEKPLSEIEEVSKIAVKAASRDFEARKKLMMAAKKRFKEIQRSLI